MKKIFVFSFDDGTVHDIKMISILNKYGLKGTFNLNSGLANYVWYNNGVAIYRLDLNEYKYIYDGHEIASHSLAHTHMTERSDEDVVYEVKQDIENLENIFQRKITSFAFPFSDFSQREIDLIKNNNELTNIRVTELFKAFKKLDGGLFIFAGHSYDFYMNNSFDQLEQFVKELSKCKDIEVMTMQEMVEYIKTL